MTLRNGYLCEERAGRLCFGTPALTLIFDLETGCWVGAQRDGKSVMSGLACDFTMSVGGHMRSTIDEVNMNTGWAQLLPEGAETLGYDFRMTGRHIETEQNAVALFIEGQCGRFNIVKRFALTPDGLLERTIRLTWTGDETIALRGVELTSPCLSGFVPVENPGGQGYAAVLARNADDSLCIALWDGALREECSAFRAVPRENGVSLTVKKRVSGLIEPGETLSFGNTLLSVSPMPWRDMLPVIRDDFEARGCRVVPGDKSHLKTLLLYETEIGLIRFRPDKEHHVYDTLDDLMRDLPRIKDIGYTAVQLMPSFPFPAYSVYDLSRPEIQHGLGADLRPFIKRAHELGLRVILDVLLHGFIDREIARYDRAHYLPRKNYYPEWEKRCEYDVCPWRQEHPDWFIYDEDGDIFKLYTWSIDWANRGAQDYLIDALKKYVLELDADGFRFDAPTWVGAANWAKNLPYRGDRALFSGVRETFERARCAIDPLKKNLVWLTEPESIALRGALDVSYSYSAESFKERLWTGAASARDLQDFFAVRRRIQPKGALYVSWLDNHDSWNNGCLETGLFMAEKYSKPYARALLAVSLFQEGAYMAYAGNEKLDPDFYRTLLHLRRDNPIFSEGECSYEAVRAGDENVYACRWTLNGQTAAVLVNLSNQEITTTVSGLSGVFADRIEGGTWNADDALSLPPYGVRLYFGV